MAGRFAAYRRVFSAPHAPSFFAASVPGRFGVAMVTLASLVFVQRTTGSYRLAGVCVSVLALCNAGAAPIAARLAARHGQAPVLRLAAVCLLFGAGAVTGSAPLRSRPLLVCGLALTGMAMPQVGAIAVSRWSAVVTAPADLRAAFAVESMSTDVTFLTGPALVSLAVSAWGPVPLPAVAVGLVALSAALLASAGGSEPPRTAPDHRGHRPRLWPLAAPMAAVNVAVGGFFGATQVGVIAAVSRLGHPDAATAVYGLMSASSLVSGLCFGALGHRGDRAWRTLAVGFLGLCGSALWLAHASRLAPVLALLIVGGVFVAPTIISAGLIVRAATPPERVHGTFSVLTSAQYLGNAAGAAAAGALVAACGPAGGFLAAAAATVLGAVAAAIGGLTATVGAAQSPARETRRAKSS